MSYRTKVIINGAELLDAQSDATSSITDVTLSTSCGQGFQIGATAASALKLTILRPYKDKFDGDKVDLYLMEGADTDSAVADLFAEVGASTETAAIEDDELDEEVTTAEEEEAGEDATDAEESEATAEVDEAAAAVYETMNGAEDTTETEIVTEDTVQGWDLYGSFYVYKQTNNSDGSITLLAYDGFSLMNGTYTPGVTSGTFQQYYDDLRSQLATLGVVMDGGEWDDPYTITWNQVATYREAVGYLAGLQGGFATFGNDSTLGISQYGYSDGILLKSQMQSWQETSSGETEIDSIKCTTNLAGSYLLAGEAGGQPLSCYNPFMAQDILDGILAEYNGITYTGAVFSCNWDAGLLSGELVRVMSDAEFKNLMAMQNAMANSSGMTADEILELKKQINSVGKSILVSSQTISFTAGGEAVTEITSYLPTESEKANAPLSPADAKFRTVTADLIKTKELIADKASITDLEATTARVSTLEAETVKASELDTKVATIAKAEISSATIKDAQIESINGSKILDGSIVAAALSQGAIKSFGGNDVYYQAEAPTGDLKDGDLWFKTVTETSGSNAGILHVYSNGAWANKPLDSESILAKSITAGQIASGTITAGEIDIDNLQTNLARIGPENGNNVLITGTGVQIEKDGSPVATYGENVVIGDENAQNITIEPDRMSIKAGSEKLFSVDEFASGSEIVTTWVNTDLMEPNPDIGPEISGKMAFSVDEINSAIAEDGSYTGEFFYNFFNKGAKKIWFELKDGGTVQIDKADSGSALHYEEYSGDDYYKSFYLVTSEELARTDIIALRASYDIDFYPAIVDIGQYHTKDIINYDGMDLYDFKALKIGSGIASENNRRDAFTIDFLGNGYFGNTVIVEEDVRAMEVKAANVDANMISAENISAENISATNISSAITSGKGKTTCTTGAVGAQMQYSICGNVVQIYGTVKATGSVASGKNIAVGTLTGIPKPVQQFRSVSYYGNNPCISLIQIDGSFVTRNAGADALATGNEAAIASTYISDGTML